MILSEESNNNKLNNLFELNNDNSEEINFYFQKLNSLLIKGNIRYLENFPLPIINEDSLVYYVEQDQKILREYNKYNLNFVNSFQKYTELSIEQKYSVLSKNDILFLKFLDEQISRNFKSNYYMNRNINVKVGELIFIKINITNPLNINLSIKNITLIINKLSNDYLNNNSVNRTDYNCGFYNLDIPAHQTLPIGFKLTFNSSGDYEISGMIMTLFKNINLKYFFNKRKINSLYLHTKKLKDNTNNNLIKKNFLFKAIDSLKYINVIINNNDVKISMFQNQISYLPIKIINNNNDNDIKKYTVFLETDNEIIIYPKYIHNDYLNNINYILIPIIGKNVGECRLKIIIKYEEKIKSFNNDLDIYRNVISIKVSKGIYLNIDDTAYEYNKINNMRKIKLNMGTSNINNVQSILFSFRNCFLLNKEKFSIEINNNNFDNIETIQDKNINIDLLVKLINKEIKGEFISDNFFDDVIEKNNYQNYEYIIQFLKCIFYGENNLIIKYKLNFYENNKISTINCLYKHEIKFNVSLNNNYYFDKNNLKSILKNCFSINYDSEDINKELKYINIYIKMIKNNEYFEKIKNIIDFIEVKVNKNNNNFDWIGIHSSIYKDLEQEKIDDDNVKTFNCLINDKSFSLNDKKNSINLNQFTFSVKIQNSDIIYQFTDFPSIIYYSVN